jgi:hypothetical protein
LYAFWEAGKDNVAEVGFYAAVFEGCGGNVVGYVD